MTGVKIDVGVLKEKVSTLTDLCVKMDTVIDKLVESHDRHITKVYENIDDQRDRNSDELKELRKELQERMDESETNLITELKSIRQQLTDHINDETANLKRIMKWKKVIVIAFIVLTLLVLNHSSDAEIGKFFRGILSLFV